MVKVLRYTPRVQRLAAGSMAAFLSIMVLTAFHSPPALAAESSCPGIHIEVLNIANGKGKVDCALFESPSGFPYHAFHSAKNLMALKITENKATCDFENIPPGTYAVVVIHDENANGKLDTDVFGKPKEGFGFSNSAKASLRAPSFSDASFRYEGGNLHLTITLQY